MQTPRVARGVFDRSDEAPVGLLTIRLLHQGTPGETLGSQSRGASLVAVPDERSAVVARSASGPSVWGHLP